MKKTIGVFWGRFNPPHKGHIDLARKLAMKVDTLIIVVGAAEKVDTKRNPFNGQERSEMLRRYLREEQVRAKVVAVKDGESWETSIDNLFEKCGKFDVLFTNHRVITKMVGDKVNVVGFRRTKMFSSTQVRNRIARGQGWEQLTGKSVAKLIRKFEGIERIRRAYQF